MKETVNLWLSRNAQLPGVLACCVFYPDRTTFSQTWSAQFPADALENAWRCVADSFQVLHLNRFPAVWVRWVFAHAFLYCARRGDGVSIALFAAKDSPPFEPEKLDQLLADFHQLPTSPVG